MTKCCRTVRGAPEDSSEHRWIGPRAAGAHGLTLVELLLVLIVIAVLSGAAISLLSSGQKQVAADEAVQRLMTDLEYAQSDAIASRSERRVVFDENAESYGVYAGATLLWHPVSKRPFVVDLDDVFPGAGLDLDSPDFGGSDTLRFDSHGVPIAAGQVRVRGPGASWTIHVVAGTGCITLSGG
jgi:prepilin-type N-terminal cleavage/methylation domain-containing protein